MINLVLAQGAEHTKPENLKKIVSIINDERYGIISEDRYMNAMRCCDKIVDVYGCDIQNVGINVSTHTYAVEEKYDGYSYLNVEGRFFSKSLSSAAGSKGLPVEKTDRVPHLASILKTVYEQCGADLHGELYKTM